ncbi:MAG: FAD:protein FMN transferase [Phycisphaerales bacterium]
MGSKCRIVVFACDEERAAAASAAAFGRIRDLNDVLSDYSNTSEASRVMGFRVGVWHEISEDLFVTLERALKMAHATNGAFDPTVGALTKLWRETNKAGVMPNKAVIRAARDRSGYQMLELDVVKRSIRFSAQGMILDFGGIGKGHAADEAMSVLATFGLTRALIDFGGDLRLGDPPPDQPEGWKVEIQDGIKSGRTMYLQNVAVATSGDLEQSFTIDGVTYSHVIDPRTGLGLQQRVAATVIADEGWLADALASAACVLEPEQTDLLARQYPGCIVLVNRESGF